MAIFTPTPPSSTTDTSIVDNELVNFESPPTGAPTPPTPSIPMTAFLNLFVQLFMLMFVLMIMTSMVRAFRIEI